MGRMHSTDTGKRAGTRRRVVQDFHLRRMWQKPSGLMNVAIRSVIYSCFSLILNLFSVLCHRNRVLSAPVQVQSQNI